jgi:hypothetical protein
VPLKKESPLYFPSLHARRAELLALRSVSAKASPAAPLTPILEPVKASADDLARALDVFAQHQQPVALILNPHQGDFRGAAPTAAWKSAVISRVHGQANIIPAMRCAAKTTYQHVLAFASAYSSRNVALVSHDPHFTPAEMKALAAKSHIKYFVVVNSGLSSTQLAALPASRQVHVNDQFNKQLRNVDYGGPELFTDQHQIFAANGHAGFGDFVCVGSMFEPGGGPASAVAIHASYRDPTSQDIYIEHFISNDVERHVGDTASKFLQAARKLVAAAKKRPFEFGSDDALATFEQHVVAKHFPGLGASKQLQIEHHVWLMLGVLTGAL